MSIEVIALLITTIIAVISAVIAVTAMIAIMKEKVADHETRLQFHSQEIRRLDTAMIQASTDHAVLVEMLKGIKASIDEIKKQQCA